MTRFLLGSVMGLCLGAIVQALTWPLPPPPPPPPGVPFDPVRWVRSDCPPPPAPAPTEDPDDGADQELLTATLHAIAATREALELAIGTPTPFEGPIPTEDAIRARVAEVMPDQEVLWTSCEEFPCLAVLQGPLRFDFRALGAPRYASVSIGEDMFSIVPLDGEGANQKRLEFRMQLELEAVGIQSQVPR